MMASEVKQPRIEARPVNVVADLEANNLWKFHPDWPRDTKVIATWALWAVDFEEGEKNEGLGSLGSGFFRERQKL